MDDTELSEQILVDVSKGIVKGGLSYVCLSLGADGAMLISHKVSESVDEKGIFRVDKRPAIPVSVRSLQGAGDAMVAGLCKAIYEGREEKMLDYALAMAASTISLEGTQMGNIE